MSSEPRVPRVFISYSHDSREHKQWVLELAQLLRKEGIDPIIDQWDLEFGDDVPKFMEKAVTESERVLMICTEPYVQKADGGRGGAGYEAMVVTQELIQNLGTKKFIPIIRQANPPILLPKCIGTRMAVNLSEYHAGRAEDFTRLVSQLHQAPPATKPPLGTVPTFSAPLPAEPTDESLTIVSDPLGAYHQALALARAGDLVKWRRIITAQRTATSHALLAWRGKLAPPRRDEELPSVLVGALRSYEPLFACAIAGVESGQPKFNQQASLIYDLQDPKGWERGGQTVVVALPDAAAWVYQSLIGAMCVHTGQLKLALDLATQRMKLRTASDSKPLYRTHELTGWPESLGRMGNESWDFLLKLPETFPWIVEGFGSADEFRASLAGYYLVLSWLEYLDVLKAKNTAIFTSENVSVDIMPLFLQGEDVFRGQRKVLEDHSALRDYARRLGVTPEEQAKHWAAWMNLLIGLLARIAQFPRSFFRAPEEIEHFAESVNR